SRNHRPPNLKTKVTTYQVNMKFSTVLILTSATFVSAAPSMFSSPSAAQSSSNGLASAADLQPSFLGGQPPNASSDQEDDAGQDNSDGNMAPGTLNKVVTPMILSNSGQQSSASFVSTSSHGGGRISSSACASGSDGEMHCCPENKQQATV